MPYHNWEGSFKAIIAEGDAWFELGHFVTNVVQIRKKDLSYVYTRAQALALFNSSLKCPASAGVRFPGNKFYIQESNPLWIQKFTQVRSGLQYLNHAQKVEKEGSDVSQRLVEVYRGLDDILSQVNSRDGLTNRVSFERNCDLLWKHHA